MSILDRYILRQLLQALIFSLFALSIIFVVVNLLENLDEFLDQNASISTIVKYYIYFLPEILRILTPVAMLISTLFTTGRLSSNNEIIAMKSGSISLYRIMVPLIIFGIMLSFGELYFNGWIVPHANQHKFEIEHQYLHQPTHGGPIYNLYFRDSPKRNVTMQFYDSDTKTGNRIAIEEFDSQIFPRLSKRIEADRLAYDDTLKKWKLFSGIERLYIDGNVSARRFIEYAYELNISHNEILQLKRSTEEMNFDEQKTYINILKIGGKDIRRQLIEYHGNYAFPFANLIVILFGVPFASVRRKGGLAIQIGAAMVVSFFYLVFTKISQTIGYSTELNPILAGWAANIIFVILAIIIINRTRT